MNATRRKKVVNNEEMAREIVKILKGPLIECIDEVIDQRCYIVLLKLLEEIKKKGNK
jgi:hypothetical protein